MKKILIFQWFDCKDQTRRRELLECIHHNINLGFDEVIIFNDSVEPVVNAPHVRNISTNSRISYLDFINVVKDPQNVGALVVLTNSDIKLDSKILQLAGLKNRILIALSRYESNEQLTECAFYSQDVWVMTSQPIHKSIILQSNIPLGIPGCDQRFAEIVFSAGFSVFNPCLEIKNTHLHKNVATHLDENRLFGSYLFVIPCTYEDIRLARPNIVPRLVRPDRKIYFP